MGKFVGISDLCTRKSRILSFKISFERDFEERLGNAILDQTLCGEMLFTSGDLLLFRRQKASADRHVGQHC